jgi:hypothetical protein
MIIHVSDIMKCPHVIFLAAHYRDDGTCRCNEPTCEEDGCKQDKFKKEIFCKTHLIEHYGENEFYEAEG